uniref:Uncharacterized protein n=1 Tax=Canis lupus dingo TaxID=286419 RepID=A0A8C0K9T6_CANLU
MLQYQTQEETSFLAKKLYLVSPMKTDQAQDTRKIEKFYSQQMRLMAAKGSHNVALEIDRMIGKDCLSYA